MPLKASYINIFTTSKLTYLIGLEGHMKWITLPVFKDLKLTLTIYSLQISLYVQIKVVLWLIRYFSVCCNIPDTALSDPLSCRLYTQFNTIWKSLNFYKSIKKILGLMSAIFHFFTFSLVLLTFFQCQNFKCLSSVFCFAVINSCV